MQDIISGVIVPPGFQSIDDVFKAYEEYEAGQKKKEEPKKPPSVNRQVIEYHVSINRSSICTRGKKEEH